MFLPEQSFVFTGSVKPPKSGSAAVYIGPANERAILYKWSHENPDTVHHYNVKIFINGDLISTITQPSGSVNGSSIVGQGTLYLEIEAVSLCGHTSDTYVIEDDAIKCKCYSFVTCFTLLSDYGLSAPSMWYSLYSYLPQTWGLIKKHIYIQTIYTSQSQLQFMYANMQRINGSW